MHPLAAFFRRRWQGGVPLRTLLWRDMFAVGTAVNIVATFVALIAASQGSPTWAAAAIHFLPLPYNLFLFAAVGRASPRSTVTTVLAAAWLCAMTVA